MALSTLTSPLQIAGATSYSGGVSRGVPMLSYVETDFWWETNDDAYNSMHDSRAHQWTGGMGTVPGGATRYFTNYIEHDWVASCRVTFGVGKMSYSVPFNDNVALWQNGYIGKAD